MSLSTHVLDTALGRPAGGMRVRWQTADGAGWVDVAENYTDGDGRIDGWAPATGVHRLVFDIETRFGADALFPEVAVTFRGTDPLAHHHIPLLLSPFAYSTYRGS